MYNFSIMQIFFFNCVISSLSACIKGLFSKVSYAVNKGIMVFSLPYIGVAANYLLPLLVCKIDCPLIINPAYLIVVCTEINYLIFHFSYFYAT